MIHQIKLDKKDLLFLIILVLTINASHTASFFTKQLTVLKTKTYTTYSASMVIEQPTAMINPLAQAFDFNLFVEESVSTVNGDIEGTAALGGDLSLIGKVCSEYLIKNIPWKGITFVLSNLSLYRICFQEETSSLRKCK